MEFPDHTTVLFKLASRPDFSSDSLDLETIILSERHQRVAARCVENNVIYDYREGKKTTLPREMMETLQRSFERQVEVGKYHHRQVMDVMRAVEELEKA